MPGEVFRLIVLGVVIFYVLYLVDQLRKIEEVVVIEKFRETRNYVYLFLITLAVYTGFRKLLATVMLGRTFNRNRKPVDLNDQSRFQSYLRNFGYFLPAVILGLVGVTFSYAIAKLIFDLGELFHLF